MIGCGYRGGQDPPPRKGSLSRKWLLDELADILAVTLKGCQCSMTRFRERGRALAGVSFTLYFGPATPPTGKALFGGAPQPGPPSSVILRPSDPLSRFWTSTSRCHCSDSGGGSAGNFDTQPFDFLVQGGWFEPQGAGSSSLDSLGFPEGLLNQFALETGDRLLVGELPI